MQGSIVAQGVELMLYGMGTVVLFLALLVLITGAMSRIVGRSFPEPQPPAPPPRPAAAPRATTDDARLVAVISAAVERYRREHS